MSLQMRAQNAFKSLRKKTASSQNEDEDFNHMARIHELPRSPRFSTFMSPEAQYAMMKGNCRVTMREKESI